MGFSIGKLTCTVYSYLFYLIFFKKLGRQGRMIEALMEMISQMKTCMDGVNVKMNDNNENFNETIDKLILKLICLDS